MYAVDSLNMFLRFGCVNNTQMVRPDLPDGLWNQFKGVIQHNEEEEIGDKEYSKILKIAQKRLRETYE